jgi:putative flippase GtrA
MNKKDLMISVVAGLAIGLLTIPTINNLPLPGGFAALGTAKVALMLGFLSIVGYVVSELLAKKLSVFRQIGRFAIVGVLNTVLDFAVLNVLISASGIAEGVVATSFAGISFTVAVINSYYWNKYWTFELKGKVEREFLQFFVVSLVGFGLNIGAFHTVVNIIGPAGNATPEAWANLGKLAGTFAGLIWNFIGYKFIVFKRKTSPT